MQDLLFFAPHMALYPHVIPEALLARALTEQGQRVRYLVCGESQTYCSAMTARRLIPTSPEEQTKLVCRSCRIAAQVVSRTHGFPMERLGDYLTQDDISILNSMAASASEQKSLDTEYLGVNVGRLSLYEFTLFHKKMSTDLSVKQWEEYRVYLFNALRSLHAFSKYLESHHPSTIICFSPQYSNNNSCMQYAINKGIRVLFIESGVNISHRLGTLRVWDWGVHGLVNPALTYWKRSEDNPTTLRAVSGVVNHFEKLLSGQHFAVFSQPYSGAKSIREFWNIGQNQKILLMTLSSYDEAYSAFLIGAFPEKKVFSDVFHTQLEWIKSTIDWVKARPDVFLVIRVHPRDFPNKRENMRSEQSHVLESVLESPGPNIRVNWPSENISLYEFLEDTDVLLTGWSVTAMEALILGIPVVTYDSRLPSYPDDIHYTGRSQKEYYSNIDKALNDGWSLQNSINGFRWLSYNFMTCSIVVSKTFGKFEFGPRRGVRRLWQGVKNRLFPAAALALDLLRWRGAVSDACIVSTMIERQYDAIPPARQAVEGGGSVSHDDRAAVIYGLKMLHKILYADSQIPLEKPGLSRNILSVINREIQS